MKENIMRHSDTPAAMISRFFGLVVILLGVLNLVFVHPLPAFVYGLLSVIYFPVADEFVMKKFEVPVPNVARIILAIAILWFTLGISDLGNMIDKI